MPSQRSQHINRAILLAALHPESDSFRSLLAGSGPVLDWPWLIERSAAHKVVALLADRVATMANEALIPAEARQRLHDATLRASDRYAQAIRALEQVDRRLRQAGIEYVLMKGPVLTAQVYDRSAQRNFFDLDLLVREAEVDAAQSVLEQLGYRLWGGDRYLGFAPKGPDNQARATRAMRAALRRFGHEVSLTTSDGSLLPIDLHWHLLPRGRIRRRAAASLWENTTTTRLGAVDVRVLDREATVLHLAMHAWSNRPWSFALSHLCDFAWALSRLPIDFQALTRLADRWGGRADLARSLYATEGVLAVGRPTQLQVDSTTSSLSDRFRRLATPENLVEGCACPAPKAWARLKRDIDWGIAIGSLNSTAILLLARYAALLCYHTARQR
ncbi:MAG: nucleotidyltransferase family protein [Deltaproteobacteria bacterium]|nr:nucleotidyltransferase family protein [Deltaproteobacteria bacterium]